MGTKINGIKAKHAIVSPTCRTNKGNYNAGHEAAIILVNEYFTLACLEINKDAKFNFVLTVERPNNSDKENVTSEG